jgi:hypothetical protein
LLLDPDPDPYLLLEDLDLDPGGPKTHGSDGSGFGSATLLEINTKKYNWALALFNYTCGELLNK